MKRNASKRKEQLTSDPTSLGGSTSKKKKKLQSKSPGAETSRNVSAETVNKQDDDSRKPSELLAEHLGMKLEYTVKPEDEPGLNYKKFVRLVHKQITSCNPGFPNSKINTVIGAAWKDFKAELQHRDAKEKEIMTGDGSKMSAEEKNVIEPVRLTPLNTALPRVETSKVKPDVEVIDVPDISKDHAEKVKASLEKKKGGAGLKKRRVIGPLRIKLKKPPTNKKSQKSIDLSDDSNDEIASEEEPTVKKLKNRTVQELGDDTDKSSDTGSTSSRSKKRKKNGKKKITIEIDSGDEKLDDEKQPKKKKTKLNEKGKRKKAKKKRVVVKRRRRSTEEDDDKVFSPLLPRMTD